MSARKAQRRPKARKVKLHDIQGHKLTDEQLAEYMSCLCGIERQFPQWSSAEQRSRALSDCFYRWRPSVRAVEEFRTMALYQQTQNAMHTIGSLKDIPINIAGKGVTKIGNDLIAYVAGELELVAHRLRIIHRDIAQELEAGKEEPA